MPKLHIIQHLAVLMLLYMFCSILCLTVENTFWAISVDSYGVIINDYWRCLSYMILGFGIFLLCEFLPEIPSKNERNKLVWCPLLALLVFSTVNISNILYMCFLDGVRQGEGYILLISIFSIIAYIAWCYLERSEQRKKNKKLYYSIVSTVLFSFVSIGGYLSNLYMPIKSVRTLREDSKTQEEVNNLESILTNTKKVYKDTEEVMKNVGTYQQEALKSGLVRYQKVTDNEFSLSWNLKTDFENIKNSKQFKKMFSEFYSSSFQYKQGENKKVLKVLKNLHK
ncbi:MAG: hypothetical protein LBI26_00330 [Holosporales bacterium]|nr:hypothetical protein [Holosporales bacterium]